MPWRLRSTHAKVPADTRRTRRATDSALTSRSLRRRRFARWPSPGEFARYYLWGLDIAGQRDGRNSGPGATYGAGMRMDAGGIGGLQAVIVKEGGTEKIYLPVCDQAGSIVAMVDGRERQVVARFEYSPFGVLTGEWYANTVAKRYLHDGHRFQGKFHDREIDLMYFGHRYYDASSGKWLTRDPLQEKPGPNMFMFCNNDPVNNVDPDGRDWQGKVSKTGGQFTGRIESLSELATGPATLIWTYDTGCVKATWKNGLRGWYEYNWNFGSAMVRALDWKDFVPIANTHKKSSQVMDVLLAQDGDQPKGWSSGWAQGRQLGKVQGSLEIALTAIP